MIVKIIQVIFALLLNNYRAVGSTPRSNYYKPTSKPVVLGDNLNGSPEARSKVIVKRVKKNLFTPSDLLEHSYSEDQAEERHDKSHYFWDKYDPRDYKRDDKDSDRYGDRDLEGSPSYGT